MQNLDFILDSTMIFIVAVTLLLQGASFRDSKRHNKHADGRVRIEGHKAA